VATKTSKLPPNDNSIAVSKYNNNYNNNNNNNNNACKDLPQQAEVAQGVLGRLRSWIFLTFGITRVVVRRPYALAAFTPGEITGTYF